MQCAFGRAGSAGGVAEGDRLPLVLGPVPGELGIAFVQQRFVGRRAQALAALESCGELERRLAWLVSDDQGKRIYANTLMQVLVTRQERVRIESIRSRQPDERVRLAIDDPLIRRALDRAETVREKFNVNLKDCPTCDYRQYACICGHGEGDHDDHDDHKDEKK